MNNPILTANPRNEAWRTRILSNTGTPLGWLKGRLEGKYDFSIHNTIRTGGSVKYVGSQPLNWGDYQLQPWYIIRDNEDNDLMSWPLGVFIPEVPKTQYTSLNPNVDLQLYDKLLILSRDKTDTAWGYDTGAVVTDCIQEIIESAGQTNIAITESDLTLSAPVVWDINTPKLTMVNKLLKSINYFSLWADGYGSYRAEPYRRPQDRPKAWEFIDDRRGIYLPKFTHEADTFSVPNKVTLISKTEGDEEPFVATATNENPESPWSYQRRGNQWITYPEYDVEAANQTILQELADRKLYDLSQVTSSFELTTPILPRQLNERARFRNVRSDIDVSVVIQEFSISTDIGKGMTFKLRQVV